MLSCPLHPLTSSTTSLVLAATQSEVRSDNHPTCYLQQGQQVCLIYPSSLNITPSTAMSPTNPPDSWIEISPSPIIATGLALPHSTNITTDPTDPSSSQDEYSESSSSTDALPSSPPPAVFTPPPHAFNARTPSIAASTSASAPRPARPMQRHSAPPDHDAALRASLTTLLSCAAAARSLPKARARLGAPRMQGGERVQAGTLRLVPGPRRSSSRGSHTGSNSGAREHKRKTSPSPAGKERGAKRARGMEGEVHPTLLTWVVSAGVIVLVGALSFSAGYATGREVGRVGSGEKRSLGIRRRLWSEVGSVVRV